jgi:hypothetical protein
MQLRLQVTEAPSLWSPWVTIASGTVDVLPQLSAGFAETTGPGSCATRIRTDTGTYPLNYSFIAIQNNNNFQDPNARLSYINCTSCWRKAVRTMRRSQGIVFNKNTRTFNTFENVSGVLYTPNNTGVQPFDPVFEAIALPLAGGGTFSPRYAGFRQRSNALETQFATPDDTVKLWRPGAGSPLIGAASGVVAYDDYLGNLRGANPDRGVVER